MSAPIKREGSQHLQGWYREGWAFPAMTLSVCEYSWRTARLVSLYVISISSGKATPVTPAALVPIPARLNCQRDARFQDSHRWTMDHQILSPFWLQTPACRPFPGTRSGMNERVQGHDWKYCDICIIFVIYECFVFVPTLVVWLGNIQDLTRACPL